MRKYRNVVVVIGALVFASTPALAAAQPTTTAEVVNACPSVSTTTSTATTTTTPTVPSTTSSTTTAPTTTPDCSAPIAPLAPEPQAPVQATPQAPAATTTPQVTASVTPSPSAVTTTTAEAAPAARIPYTGLPTENPNDTVVPGKMRSDREEFPEGFTKEQADQAEIFEAELLKQKAMQRGASVLAAPTDCRPYWPTNFQVCGEIRVKYDSLGGSTSFLGPPSANDAANPDNYGRRQTFWNGPIYWSPATGAHPVVNHFFAAWQRNGWESGVLKYPKTDELGAANGGRKQEFQGGTIYWHLNEGYFVGGAIRDKWNTVGAEGGFLGYPVTDEQGTPNGGRFNRFEHGAIYWSAATGAQAMSDVFFAKWASLGYETGYLGYPVAGDVLNTDGIGRHQQFQGGYIYWHPIFGAKTITGRIYEAWGAQGYENGPLGYPLSDERATPAELAPLGQRMNSFLRGGLVYNSADNQVTSLDRVNFEFN